MNKVVREKHEILNWLRSQTDGNGNRVYPNVTYDNLSQSYLRRGAALGTQGNVQFAVTETSAASELVTDNLLKQNDLFVMTELAVCYGQIASDTPTDTLLSKMILHSYVNPNIFSGTNSVNVAAIPNGKLSLSINNVKFIPAISMRDFERVGTSQQGTVVAVDAASADSSIARDEKTLGDYGYYPTDLIAFNGTQKVEPVIDWGVSLNMDDSSLTNYITILMKGYLVSNFK